MTWGSISVGAATLWLTAAVLLGIAELIIPGVFLIFLALAAAAVGLATFALPDLSLMAQLGTFGAWSVVSVLIGRRWYRDYPIETSDPLLNDRASRMTGQIVVVAEAIIDGRGRVRVGDGEWPASGPDAPVGSRMRVVTVADGIVAVETI